MITWGTDALSTSRGIYSKRSDSSIRFIITSQLDMQFWDWSSEAKATKTITLRLDEQCESPLLLSRKCSLLLKDVGSKPTSQHIIIQRCQEQPGIANHKAADISGASRYHKFIMIKMKNQTNFRSDIQHQARARMLRANAWSMAKSFHSAVSRSVGRRMGSN